MNSRTQNKKGPPKTGQKELTMKHTNTVSFNPNDFLDDEESPDKPPKLVEHSEKSGKPQYRDFVIPASDAQGHSTKVGFRCNNAYVRRINIFISSKKFPYKTPSDLLRHALDRHLKYLSQLEPEIGVEMASIEVVNEIINAKQERIDFGKSFEKLSLTVQDLLSRGAQGEAKRLVLEVSGKVERMDEGYWRDWYSQEIKNRFGYLLEGAKGD